MAETSWPFDGDPLPEDGWSKMARLFAGPGVVGDPGSSAVQPFADSSGMNVFVRAGSAMLRGHYYNNSAQLSVAIPSNGAGSARIDRIVLRLDPTDNEIRAERIAGTAGAGAPALTQTDTGTWDLPLAQVRVEPGAVNIAATKVTDERLFSGLDVLPCLTVSQIPNPRMFQLAGESSTGALKMWTGSAWSTVFAAAHPAGVLDYAQKTTGNQTDLAALVEHELTGLDVTVTAVAGRKMRISYHVPARQLDAAGVTAALYVVEGTTRVGRCYQGNPAAAQFMTFDGSVVLSPSAGSHTYHLALTTAGGTIDTDWGSIDPAFILAEDIGT